MPFAEKGFMKPPITLLLFSRFSRFPQFPPVGTGEIAEIEKIEKTSHEAFSEIFL
jgi:hypothetical protein